MTAAQSRSSLHPRYAIASTCLTLLVRASAAAFIVLSRFVVLRVRCVLRALVRGVHVFRPVFALRRSSALLRRLHRPSTSPTASNASANVLTSPQAGRCGGGFVLFVVFAIGRFFFFFSWASSLCRVHTAIDFSDRKSRRRPRGVPPTTTTTTPAHCGTH